MSNHNYLRQNASALYIDMVRRGEERLADIARLTAELDAANARLANHAAAIQMIMHISEAMAALLASYDAIIDAQPTEAPDPTMEAIRVDRYASPDARWPEYEYGRQVGVHALAEQFRQARTATATEGGANG